MRTGFLTAVALALSASQLSAQSFNLDFGEPATGPSSSYAAAGLPGYWNAIRADSTPDYILSNLTGNATNVHFHQVGGAPMVPANDPSINGDDALLLNDGLITFNPGLDSCFYFNGLTPGTYELITYAWRPNDPTLMAKSFVDNTPGLEISGGAWPGYHAHNGTYARHIVTVDASGFMGPHSGLAAGANAAVGAVCNGMQLRKIDEHAAFCPGDGTGGACPCNNNGASGHGCGNSAFAAGALLSGSGAASVALDGVVLSAANMTGATCVFFQGSGQMAPVIVDDGLGCVTGTVVRLGTKSIAGSASSYPEAGDPSVSVRGAIPGFGGTYRYQCFYRNAVTAFCPPATSNRTNGVVITWVP